MKRVIVVLVLLALAATQVLRSATTSDVPCITVERLHFEHRVTADGVLRATTATPIVIPPNDLGSLTLAYLAPDGTLLEADAVIARFDRTRADRNLRDAETELAAADVRLRQEQLRSTATIAEQAAAVTKATRDAEAAHELQATDPTVVSKNQLRAAALDETLARARLEQAQRVRDGGRSILRANLELAALARQRAAVAVAQAREALAHVEIRAPHAGLLLLQRDDRGELPKLGARLWPEQTIAELPEPSEVEASLFVLEVDGTGLAVGQPANIVVASLPDAVLRGTIKAIDKLAKPRDARVPVNYIGVTVALERTDRALKLGQRVRGTLVLDRDNVLAIPRTAVFDRAGTAIVYRRDARGFTPVTVELGAVTAGRVEITSGLNAGDLVALREPEAR